MPVDNIHHAHIFFRSGYLIDSGVKPTDCKYAPSPLSIARNRLSDHSTCIATAVSTTYRKKSPTRGTPEMHETQAQQIAVPEQTRVVTCERLHSVTRGGGRHAPRPFC